MTKEELWDAYETRNPSFGKDEGNVTMSAQGLKKLFSQTWSIAYDSGYRQGTRDSARKQEADTDTPRRTRHRDPFDVFSEVVFGTKK